MSKRWHGVWVLLVCAGGCQIIAGLDGLEPGRKATHTSSSGGGGSDGHAGGGAGAAGAGAAGGGGGLGTAGGGAGGGGAACLQCNVAFYTLGFEADIEGLCEGAKLPFTKLRECACTADCTGCTCTDSGAPDANPCLACLTQPCGAPLDNCGVESCGDAPLSEFGGSTCAPCLQAHCCNEVKACPEGSECLALFRCEPCIAAPGCTKEWCERQHPDGVEPLDDLYNCAVQHCPNDCGTLLSVVGG